MPYSENDVGGKVFIGVDKDFSYIKILTEVWICEIFICLVHVFRHWKDKILPSAMIVRDDGSESLCPGSDKKDIYRLIEETFRSPTEDIYEENRQKILEETRNIKVKGNPNRNHWSSFKDVYEENWVGSIQCSTIEHALH